MLLRGIQALQRRATFSLFKFPLHIPLRGMADDIGDVPVVGGDGEVLSKSEQKRRAKEEQKNKEKAEKAAIKAAAAAAAPPKEAGSSAPKVEEEEVDPSKCVQFFNSFFLLVCVVALLTHCSLLTTPHPTHYPTATLFLLPDTLRIVPSRLQDGPQQA